MRKRTLCGCEKLESRRCLAVTVQVIDGDLVVEGEAEGPVEIAAVGEGKFSVTDNGTEVMTAEVVTDDIRIVLDTDGSRPGDAVTLKLNGQAVDKVIVKLGDGDNQFVLEGGVVRGSLRYEGGDGDDSVEISSDAVVEKALYARLGDGDNSVSVGGSGDASTTQDTSAVGAVIEGKLSLHTGDGNDTVQLLAGSAIERSVSLRLGDGDNSLSVGGSGNASATQDASTGGAVIEGNLSFRAGDGNDTVRTEPDATVRGNVCVGLGGGENHLVHSGSIEGNLCVRSANKTDETRTEITGSVGGETILDFGDEFGPRPPEGHHHDDGDWLGGGWFGFGQSGRRGGWRR